MMSSEVKRKLAAWIITYKMRLVILDEYRSLRKYTLKCILLLIPFLFTGYATALEKIYFNSAESSNDVRFDYDFELLKLALEKTRGEFGDYVLIMAPPMNAARAQFYLEKNEFKNFITKQSFRDEILNKNIAFADFPVDLGIVGYRICFVNETKISDFSQAKSIEDLAPFIHVQGKGWLDVEILRNSHLNVIESVVYEGLFKLVAKGRVDLFCRGANELFSEYDNRSNEDGLVYDKKILLYYHQPKFFMSNIENTKIINRIEKGLLAAFKDGSLIKLWTEKYGASIRKAKINNRVRIELENPFIKNIGLNYLKFLNQFESTLSTFF